MWAKAVKQLIISSSVFPLFSLLLLLLFQCFSLTEFFPQQSKLYQLLAYQTDKTCQWDQFIAVFVVFMGFLDNKKNIYCQPYLCNDSELLPTAILPSISQPQTWPPLYGRGPTPALSTRPAGSGRYTRWRGRPPEWSWGCWEAPGTLGQGRRGDEPHTRTPSSFICFVRCCKTYRKSGDWRQWSPSLLRPH